MHKLLLTIIAGCLLAPTLSRAADEADDKALVGREVGSVLAWRLGPEAVEEACRAVDPAGAEARAKALKAWEENNAALIKEVDEQVADVVPLAFPAPAELDSVVAVREQVKEMIVEPMVLGKAPEETAAICKAMADPTHPRWNSNGMPQVKLALSTLYDWQFRHTAK